MSVDLDDVILIVIKEIGVDLVIYGLLILLGVMFLFVYYGEVLIMGILGCVMYYKIIVFDIVLFRVLIDEKFDKYDIVRYGYGGFCMNCDVCIYFVCNFVKI